MMASSGSCHSDCNGRCPGLAFAGSISASYVPLVNRLASTNTRGPVLMHAASQALADVLVRYRSLPGQVRSLLLKPLASSASPNVRLAYLLAQRRVGRRRLRRTSPITSRC